MSETGTNPQQGNFRISWASSVGGWALRSPLIVRLAFASLMVFLGGFSVRFDNPNLPVLFGVLMLVGFAWAGFAAFSKIRGLVRDGDVTRWIRITVWALSPLLFNPLVSVGNTAGLVVAPWSEAEIAQFEAEEAAALAEQEAIEAEERARVEQERAAEEEARREQEALRLERLRLEELAGAVMGLTQDEAAQVLDSEAVEFDFVEECFSGDQGIVVGTEVDGVRQLRMTIYVSTGPTEIPDVVGQVEARAEQLIERACYSVETRQYYTTESREKVVAVEPSPGAILEAGDTVKLMSTKPVEGETRSEDSVGRWSYLGPSEEEWSFRGPFELNGDLYIPIEAAFSTAMEWRGDNEEGEGFGTAVIVDQFNKEVPVTVQFGKKSVPAGEPQNFTAVIPLTDLDDQTPTKVYIYLAVDVGGTNRNVTAEFTMTW